MKKAKPKELRTAVFMQKGGGLDELVEVITNDRRILIRRDREGFLDISTTRIKGYEVGVEEYIETHLKTILKGVRSGYSVTLGIQCRE